MKINISFKCETKLHDLLKEIIEHQNDEEKIKSVLKIIESEHFDEFVSNADAIIKAFKYNAPLAIKAALNMKELAKCFNDIKAMQLYY